MKYIIVAISLLLSLAACQKEPLKGEPISPPAQEQVAYLQVDYLTTTFEGGTEWTFNAHPTFTIVPNYQPPGDFGNLSLTYQEENATIFDGGIHWMGKGTLQTPSSILPAASFPLTTAVVQPPAFEEIEYVTYTPDPPASIEQDLWQAIKNLQLVENYLRSNPNGKLHYFLYTPSVGIGDPADWDWVIYLKD